MSNLAALGAFTSIVTTSKGPLTLRGISFNDVTFLVSRHLEVVKTIFEGLPKPKEGQSVEEFLAESEITSPGGEVFAATLAQTAPALIADLIACVCGDPNSEDDRRFAGNLPIGLQVEIVTEAIHLTFSETGGAKKFMETVAKVIPNVKGAGPKA